jgi:hypothetical protein
MEKITNLMVDQTVGILSKFVKGTGLGKLVENMIIFAIESCEECRLTKKIPVID